MTIEMTILGWQSKGLRCPDHKLALDGGETAAKVSLLQMPNGTGKTTTLNLIRAALSGCHHSGHAWTKNQTMDLRKLSDGRQTAPPSTGEFQLTFDFKDRRYSITLQFDFEQGEVRYYTTDTSGKKPGHHPPHPLKPFLNPSFVDFFVFDGELADRLLDSGETAADEAIRSLFQLNKLENMKSAAERYWQDYSGGAKKVDNSLEHYRNKLTKTQHRFERFEYDLKSLEEKRVALKNRTLEIDFLVKGRVREREGLSTKVGGFERKLKQLEKKLQTRNLDAINLLRSPAVALPHALPKLENFRASLDKVKLPESTSREFFRELAEENACICGRPLDETTRAALLERSGDYLGDDDVQFLNQMKEAIFQADQSSNRPPLLQQNADAISDIAREIRETQQDLDEVMRAMGDEDPEVAKLREEDKEINQELGRIQPRIESLDSAPDQKVQISTTPELLDSVHELRFLCKLVREKIADLTGTVEIKWKCERIAQILERAIGTSSTALQEDTVTAANQTLDDLLPNNRIRILEIDKCLVLRGQRAGSVGENLSVAYAFLSTIFRRADQHSLPFIVDSPAGPIDADVRREVGSLVPKLSHQFIAFTISTERMSFLEAMEDATKQGEIDYFTLFRLPNPDHAGDVMDHMTSHATPDGMLVRSREYFINFQDNDDEEED